MKKLVNGALVDVSPEELTQIAADTAADQAAKAAAAQKATQDAANAQAFVVGLKALLANAAKQPGAAIEVQAAAAVDISAINDLGAILP